MPSLGERYLAHSKLLHAGCHGSATSREHTYLPECQRLLLIVLYNNAVPAAVSLW
jgi:hypothetical protein